MNRRHFAALSVWALMVSGGLAACGPATPSSSSADETATNVSTETVALTISAAASVQDAMRAVQRAYQETAPNVAITYNFGSSGSLAQQISQGAPADVFLSASPKWMDDLEEKSQILPGSRRDLLQNTMVLIVPRNQSDGVDFKALGTDQVGRVAIGEPESVPAGTYANEVLTAMNMLDALRSKLVFGKDVRQVLSYVETGNVDAGLVYGTDALLSDQVQVVATAAAETHSPILYPVAVVADSQHGETAQEFVDFLSTDTAAGIFQEYGFGMAP
jgi:molybdate transport system substrate-binding protein